MILGSHNSLTYLSPKSIIGRIFRIVGKCQNVDYKRQYEAGVRYFDLRVRFDKNGDLQVAHGLNTYKISVEDIYKFIRWVGETPDVYCRIMLELRKKTEDEDLQKEHFGYLCDAIENEYPGKFFGGRVIYSWEKVYDFDYNPEYLELHASVRKPYLIDDLFPIWYAKRMNKKIKKKYKDTNYIIYIDYVTI